MKEIFKKIIKHPRLVLLVYLVIIIMSALAYPNISVNYDINDYLPEDSKSTKAIETMNEEYDTGVPNARVMLKDVSISQALSYIKKINQVRGVESVIWLDDSEDITKPISFMDQNTVESFYKDKNALIDVTIKENYIIDATNDIRKIIGDENAMTGSAVNTAVATQNTVKEVALITVIGVIFVIFALILTTDSFIEPLMVILGLFAAIIINAGTNIIFGEISFVTNAAGNILQLAVSLDYSVFILHRYKEEKKKYQSHLKAMDEALVNSFSSIISSSSTTIIGFLALCFMRFEIGPDLGLALAKGISISLITVFTLTPVLILYMDNLIEKTKHKSLLPNFDKFGKFVTKYMYSFVIIFAILIIPSYLASNSNSYYYGSSHIFGLDTQLGRDTKEIEDSFGKNDRYVLILPKGNLENERKLSEDIKENENVENIISYVDTVGQTIPSEFLEDNLIKKINSKNYTRMIISVEADYEGEETYKLIDDIKKKAKIYYGNNYKLAGEGVSTYDLKNTVTADMKVVNLIAIGAVFVVLLITEKSLSIPIILVTAIETAIFINLSIPYFRGTRLFYIAYLIISSVQLGTTVDYAILFTERYCENRRKLDRKSSIVKTIKLSTTSILTSASTLTVVGFLLAKFSTHGLLSQLGSLLGFGTLASLIIVFFVLPGLLSLFDVIIEKTSLGLEFKKEGEKNEK